MFSLTTTHYCRQCDCFDVVTKHPAKLMQRLFLAKPVVVCFGCGEKGSLKVLATNEPRFLPQHISHYFIQADLRNERLLRKQIKPLTEFLGMSLIAVFVYALFEMPSPTLHATVSSMPSAVQKPSSPEWAELADAISKLHEHELLQSLKSDFDQVLEKTAPSLRH